MDCTCNRARSSDGCFLFACTTIQLRLRLTLSLAGHLRLLLWFKIPLRMLWHNSAELIPSHQTHSTSRRSFVLWWGSFDIVTRCRWKTIFISEVSSGNFTKGDRKLSRWSVKAAALLSATFFSDLHTFANELNEEKRALNELLANYNFPCCWYTSPCGFFEAKFVPLSEGRRRNGGERRKKVAKKEGKEKKILKLYYTKLPHINWRHGRRGLVRKFGNTNEAWTDVWPSLDETFQIVKS